MDRGDTEVLRPPPPARRLTPALRRDGQSNAAEFFAATDPSDRADVLRITGFEKTATGYRVRFPSVLGRVYRVETTGALPSPTWDSVAERPGTGSEIDIEANTPAVDVGFYRVRVVR